MVHGRCHIVHEPRTILDFRCLRFSFPFKPKFAAACLCCITAGSRRRMRTRWFTLSILLLGSALLVSAASADCSFLKNPDEFTVNAEHRQRMRSDLGRLLQRYLYAASEAPATVDPSAMPRKNFIDDSIFGRM